MNNGMAIGYMIMAAQDCDIDKKTIKRLERAMEESMDFDDEEKAEKVYQNF